MLMEILCSIHRESLRNREVCKSARIWILVGSKCKIVVEGREHQKLEVIVTACLCRACSCNFPTEAFHNMEEGDAPQSLDFRVAGIH